MQIRWRVLVGWGWLVVWLILGGLVAGCSSEPAVSPALEPDDLALIFFYTDN